ncbi:hypothetical protein EGC78_20800 [Shewanella frigidimarina]|uniref:hypothetical protein n=1 Tax=Shewanella sp. AC91-MNA-CIBAN-0169 TaxID=3140466 RepID=UPI000F4F2A1B|nr:hypothetical protein EGC78_20800 [Shewanella frigidimarina]
MTNRNYEPAKKEVMFIVLPLLILFIIKWIGGDLLSFIKLTDFSLATSIMYGQLVAKSFNVPDSSKKRDEFSTYQVKIFSLCLLSLTMYTSLNLIKSVSDTVYWVQGVLCVTSLIYYIPAATVINEMSKE